MVDIHKFDGSTGEFLETSEARLCQVTGTPLVPRNATTEVPPAPIAGHARVFDGEAWSVVLDRRGDVFYRAGGGAGKVEALGDDFPADALPDAPPSRYHIVTGLGWALDADGRASVREDAIGRVRKFAEGMRAKMSTSYAGKLMVYELKAKIAASATPPSDAETAQLTREAVARGLTLDELLSLIRSRSSEFRELALLIEALEAETIAAVDAVPEDEPEFFVAVQIILDEAEAEAEAQYRALTS